MNSNPSFRHTRVRNKHVETKAEKRGEETRGEIVLDSFYGDTIVNFREIEAYSFPRGPLENRREKCNTDKVLAIYTVHASERGREPVS